MTKMTNKIALEVAINAISANLSHGVKEYHYAGGEDTFSAEEAISKLTKLMDSLNKKSSSSHKPTKTQLENEIHKVKIAEIIRLQGVPMTVTEIWKFPEFHEMNTQKVSALVNQMVNDSILIKSKRGRSSVFGFEAIEAE